MPMGQGSRCPGCRSARQLEHNAERRFYRSKQWHALRRIVTAEGCLICGTHKGRIVAHHVVPRKQGGADSLENLVALCMTHHNEVEADLRAGRRSLIVEKVQRKAELSINDDSIRG